MSRNSCREPDELKAAKVEINKRRSIVTFLQIPFLQPFQFDEIIRQVPVKLERFLAPYGGLGLVQNAKGSHKLKKRSLFDLLRGDSVQYPELQFRQLKALKFPVLREDTPTTPPMRSPSPSSASTSSSRTATNPSRKLLVHGALAHNLKLKATWVEAEGL